MEQTVGEHFVLGFSGSVVPDWLRRFAGRFGLGGVILFDYDWQRDVPERNILDKAQLAELCAGIHALPGRPLVLVDQEGGRVRRLKEARGFAGLPSQEALARLPLAERETLLRASYTEMATLGIDYTLAPVLDLKLNPDNPDIGAVERAFSDQADVVRENVRLQHRIAAEAGLCLCVKHFPGLGGATTDTHKRLTDLTDVLDGPQLALFYEFGPTIAGQAVMFSHGFVRTWDEALPVSVSPVALGHARAAMPQTLFISDDLQMQGLQQVLKTPAACRQGLLAGLDLLLIGNNLLPEEDMSVSLAEGLARALAEDAALARQSTAALARIRRRRQLQGRRHG
jgi:beta-N-acetylhexosaminidase